MADMSVALRVFAETGEAQAGLRQLAEALRAMGVGQREAATLAATAGREAAQSWGEVAAPTRASAEVIDLLGLRARGAGTASSAAAREAENAWIASGLGMTGAMTAVGTALETGMPDLSGWLSQQAAGLAETARESAEAAAATAEFRAMLHPLAATAQAAADGLEQVAIAEEMGALTAQEASVLIDRLNRSLIETARVADAAGLPLDGLGPSGRAAATGLQQLIEAQTGVTRASEGSIAAQLQHGQMLDDLRARFNPLFAVTRQYEQELRDIAEAERLTAITAGEAAEARDRAAAAYGRATGATGPLAGGIARVGQASGAAAAYTANLGYQVNDIAMMMAAGQNPFMLMMQQGTQVTQVFQQMQQAGIGIGASIRTALLGMVSPLSLMTMGVIGGSAALVQWLGSGSEAALTLDEAMKDLEGQVASYQTAAKAAAASTAEMRAEFGAGADDARDLLREIAVMEGKQAARSLAGTFQSLDAELGATLGNQAAASTQRAEGADWLDGLTPAQQAEARSRRELADAFAALQNAAGMADEAARLDAMVEAAQRLRLAYEAGAEAAGGLTEADERRLDTLNRLVLSAQRLKEVREAEATAEQMRKLPEPMSPGAFEAMEASWAERADLGRQAAMAALVAQHGRDSLEVARARVAEERALYEVQLSVEDISDTERSNRLAAWDAAKGMVAVERDRKAEAEKLLATLRQEEAVAQAIATYGEDSAEVARLRADQERAAFEAMVATLVPADDLRNQLMAAWENARGLGATDMASGIAAARAEARAMADEIMRALGAAQALSAQGITGLRESELRVKHAKDPVALAGALGRERMIAAQGVRRQGAEGLELAALDAEVNAYARNLEQIERNNQAQRAAIGKGGKGGGGEARDTLAGLTKEATEVLAALDLAAAGVAEKVRAGLMSVAEGETAMAQAKERAAGQLAELIARLERLGPAGKVAADAARGALRDLAAEAGKTDRTIRDGMVKSFEESFVRSLATGKDAFSSFADHVQTELARAFTQKFVTPMMSPLIDGIMGMFSGLFSARGNVIAAGHLVPYALGGVPGSALPALPPLGTHRDSVVDRPTAFPMAGNQIGVMGEAGAEAILPMLMGHAGQGVRGLAPDGSTTVLPLRRAPGGALGVQLPQAPDVGAILRRPSFFAEGGVIGRLSDPPRVGEAAGGTFGGGGRPVFNLHVQNNHPGAKIEQKERQGGDGLSWDLVIDQIDTALADRGRRGVGSLAGMLGDQFGLSRVGR